GPGAAVRRRPADRLRSARGVGRGYRRRGFNLAYAVTHETFSDIVTHLVPELQRRGVYKRDYAPGTLREKLFGGGPRLPETHVGARYRNLARPQPALDAAE